MIFQQEHQKVPHTLAERPIYSREQLSRYIQRLYRDSSFKYALEDLEAEIKVDPLAALGSLQRKQLAGIPWGNVTLHYSQHRQLSLDADALFTKLVERGLGGYCMENNTFFANVLRSLGYTLYTTAARISNIVDMNGKDSAGFTGWEHMVLLVKINGKKYHVDVGFGSQGACGPILLKEGETVQSVPGLEGRLTFKPIAPNVDDSQELWHYEMRNVTENSWRTGYCFTELEFLPIDFNNINYRTSRDPASWFTYRFVLTQVLLDETYDKPTGTITMMADSVTRRLGGEKSEVLAEFQTENDRTDALEKLFGVYLRPEEKHAIDGMVTQIRPMMTGV